MKKIISAFICFSLVLLLCASAHAVTLTCWYSNSTNGCFMNGGAKIKVAGYNTFSLSTLEGYIDYAAGKWTSAGIPAQRVNSSQNISLYAGDLTYLQTMYPNYQSNWRGLTVLNGSYSETVSYNGTSYSIYNNSNTNTTFLLYRANLTESKYKNTLLHEFGHSLGWYDGHSTHSSDVMYGTGGSGTSLRDRDKKQVKQMY